MLGGDDEAGRGVYPYAEAQQGTSYCYDAVSGLVESPSGCVFENLTLHAVKFFLFLFTIIKNRSIAFQPCITLGGVHWVEMGQKNIFSKKAFSLVLQGNRTPPLFRDC